MNFKLLLGLSFSILSLFSFGQVVSVGSPISVIEGSGTPMSFLVSLDNGAINTTGSDITGTLSLMGTATPGIDYLAATSFAIPNGSNSVGVLMPIADDILCEGDETVIVTISSVSAGTINPTAGSATATIFDDDCGTLLIAIGSPVDGAEGSADITFDIDIVTGGPSASPINGTIVYSGDAVDGADYIGVYSYTIPAGSAGTTITVPVIDDAAIELTESVTATLTGSPNIGSYANTVSTANIIDNDASSLAISIGSPIDGSENGGSISYVISLDGGVINNTGSAITGSISYAGTANSSDYAAAPTLFSIPNGQNSTTIVLVVLDDNCIEYPESVEATISNPSVGTINNATSTAYIADDDAPVASISIGSPVDGAEPGMDASFTVSLDNGLINCSGVPITGSISYLGTAVAGVDYIESNTFSIPDGSSFTIVTATVIDDTLYECDETIIATISSPLVGVINPSATSSTAIIEDDECTNDLDELMGVNVSIYPNPVENQLSVKSEYLMTEFTILDINGRVIHSGRVDAKEFQTSTEFLASGTYFVEVSFEDGRSINKKILIK